MTALPEAAAAIFSSPVFANLAVVDDTGLPHVTPIWVDVNPAGELIVNTAVGRVKDRLLGEGAKLAISASPADNPYAWALVRGHVAERRLETGDADIDALAEKYMGVDSYPFRKDGEVRVTIVIAPDRVVLSG